MSDRMTCMPFDTMLSLIAGEYERGRTIFGIPENRFFRKKTNRSFTIFGERCDTPVGPAAGPHTQLSQNIITSYLCGGRFMELKTVQKMDCLEFEKPCIDARDEAYNTEWSTELSLARARGEYTRAWIILHLLETVFDLGTDPADKGFVFNMSIGYDLDGIKTEPMDAFVEGLIDAGGDEDFARYLDELSRYIASDSFLDTFGAGAERAKGLADRISSRICRSVTLSTMHGCPPEEQESICRYLLSEKNLPTYVKLNPTLLGYERARESLDRRGFGYIGLREETFLHDLQYADALGMLKNLKKLAESRNLAFGVKLSNTLASVNPGDVLPGEEQYMSGRALFPLTLLLADLLQKDFPHDLPVSFAGGASFYNAAELFSAGIRPITCATELLKPSGYLRMAALASSIDETADEAAWEMRGVDRDALSRIREPLTASPFFAKEFRGTDRPSVASPLPPYDCYTAPCSETCPIGQDVPEYIRLAGEGRYDEALECIYRRNPLPSVTGTICDHTCMTRCTRLDYEGPVRIRDVKLLAAERGRGFADTIGPPESENGLRAAVVGAGPSGLAAAFFLRRAGFGVTVFEKESAAGGVVRHVLPGFRIPTERLERDISRIEAMGVAFTFNSGSLSIDGLKGLGYDFIFLGIGADVSRPVRIEGDMRIIDSLDFLRTFKKDPGSLDLGRRVAVIGGGNTAMDGARAASRVKGVEQVSILYRRTEDQMPADREEFDNALSDGVRFMPLVLPESSPGKGRLLCRVMTLGDPGPDGRPAPVPTEETHTLEVDTVISAVGEHVNYNALKALGLDIEPGSEPCNPDTMETVLPGVYLGGDARRGPSTVVESMADGIKAAEDILRRSAGEVSDGSSRGFKEQETLIHDIRDRRGILFDPAIPENPDELIRRESSRCLECGIFCNKCVEVCPNRANIAVPVSDPRFAQVFQIVHIDPFCNECGNCATFCPYEGRPYRDKMTLYASPEDLASAENPGFCVQADGHVTVRAESKGNVVRVPLENGKVHDTGSVDPKCIAVIDTMIDAYGYLIDAVNASKERS